ncbi:hypothetical protein B6V01_004560, partial [Methanosarcinales archaeon ex4572_44]
MQMDFLFRCHPVIEIGGISGHIISGKTVPFKIMWPGGTIIYTKTNYRRPFNVGKSNFVRANKMLEMTFQ